MHKDFMSEVDPLERLRLLQENSVETENTGYYRDLIQEEVDEKQTQYLKNDISIYQEKVKLDNAKAEYKKEAGPLEAQNEKLRQEIATRKTWHEGTLFHIPDYTAKEMVTYNEKGEYIQSRRLKPGENRQVLPFLAKTGTAEL